MKEENDSHVDRQLLSEVAEGNAAAYKILFTRYWDQIYSTAFFFTKSVEVSEDLAQEVFARIWVRRENLKSVDRFESYLYVSARNLIFDRLRKKEFSGFADDYLMQYFSSSDIDPVQRLEFKEFNALVQRAISNLTPQQQTAFRLSRFEGLTHEEIAAKMGLSKRTVKNHMVNALLFLRKYLQTYSCHLLIYIWMKRFL